MGIHVCEGCGLVHDAPGGPSESAELAIARVNAERDVRIAELAARADRAVATTMAEAAVEMSENEADAIQDALADEEADEHVADAISAAAAGLDIGQPEPAPDPGPVIVNAPEAINEDAPPVIEEHEPEPKKSRGLGMW